ncbi:LysR family transcriptional regulator [Paraburkholderia sp. CNPSo 3274]|uniref:LysR family transcriptional regulator n=1 Tax=Paraburkholderia sp. CNPSo 3274 TaxID=2940932 RepID=UPI0020B6FF27|nr:LysR family transcriptional regulator [Paraburkholderia sp. CNPSo 3274]MCP3707113.1 LysR family transcriptional regulator [Paraburkholderia sp. CNPSo 3274]
MDYFSAMRAFRYAAELGSLSQAAAKLGVKTSTVSRCITDLEQDLAVALFNRSTRGLVLTEGGRVFYEQALQVLNSLDEARAVTAALNSSPRGLLRVTMPTAFGRRHVIRHLPEFMERFPKIDVDAVMTDDVVKIIDSGIDLAIRIGALPDSQLMARRLAQHRRIVCASPQYVARYGAPASPEELSTHVTLRFPLAADDRWIFVDRSAGPDASQIAVRIDGRIRADDTDSLLDLAVAGCGVALLPTWAIGEAVQAGQLVRLLPEWEVQPTPAVPAIWAVYPPKKTVSTKVRAFIDFYAELFSKESYWEH